MVTRLAHQSNAAYGLLLLMSWLCTPAAFTQPSVPPREKQIALSAPSQGQAGTEYQVADNSSSGLSANSFNLAKSLGILPQLNQLQDRKRYAAPADAEVTALRLELIESILTASYEARRVVNRIEGEMAQANEVNTYLTEQRDRNVRLNTYVNFISGGFTRIASGTLGLAGANHISADTIVVLEGVIQTSLASWGVYQLRGEKRLERSGGGNMLAPIIDPSQPTASNYPPSVWNYLNTVPASAKNQLTRRELLVDHWYNNGLYLMHSRHRMTDAERLQHVSGTNRVSFKLTNELLQDRMAMLADLKTVVAAMDDNLLELLQSMRK